MKLKSFNYLIGLLIIFFYSPLFWSEEKIDIWKNKKKHHKTIKQKKPSKKKINLKSSQTIKSFRKNSNSRRSINLNQNEQKVYGIYDPANFNFNLNMWSTTKAEDLRSSLKRLNKIETFKIF